MLLGILYLIFIIPFIVFIFYANKKDNENRKELIQAIKNRHNAEMEYLNSIRKAISDCPHRISCENINGEIRQSETKDNLA